MKKMIALMGFIFCFQCASAMQRLLDAYVLLDAMDMHSNKHKYGKAEMQGDRKTMEDQSECHWEYGDHEFYAVYDGHGGSEVAIIARYMLRKWCCLNEAKTDNAITDALRGGFLMMHKHLGDLVNHVGSTATVAVIKNAKIFVANTGDSRTVLCRNGVAIPLSNDHKPSRADEWQRILKAGGYVTLVNGAHRVQGSLAVSRALGDKYLSPYVIPDPEITVTEFDPLNQFLILASDGVWDVLDNRDAVTCVKKKATRILR